MDDKWREIIFLPLGKKESSAAKGCTGFLALLKDRPCICADLRPHSKSSGLPANFINTASTTGDILTRIQIFLPMLKRNLVQEEAVQVLSRS